MSEETKKKSYKIDVAFEKIADKDKKHFKRKDETY